MKAYLDHIGVAVHPRSRLAELLEILGLPITDSETVEREQVDVDWVPLPNRQKTKIELLQPTGREGAIAKYLAKSGRDGIHHLSFRVGDIEGISEELLAAGFQLVYPESREGADDCMVNFVHPASTGGILVELTARRS